MFSAIHSHILKKFSLNYSCCQRQSFSCDSLISGRINAYGFILFEEIFEYLTTLYQL
jgi:hypothetical protein